MRTTWIVLAFALVASAVFLPAGPVRADEELALFEGLVPGRAMEEQELEQYYGKGGEQLVLDCAGGNCVFAPEGNTVSNAANLNASLSSNRGITSNQQFTGDQNQVSVTVAITVNINTVTVENSAGSSLSVNQSLDFGGGVVQAFAP